MKRSYLITIIEFNGFFRAVVWNSRLRFRSADNGSISDLKTNLKRILANALESPE